MDIYNIPQANKPANFKHTLDHLPGEWFDSITLPIAWDDLQQRNSQYFSTQGRSINTNMTKGETSHSPPDKMIWRPILGM